MVELNNRHTFPRVLSVDALRGFAILTMVLSGVIPYKVLPAWMYHAQLPPPTHTFDPHLPGLTWVDLVFPLFLFSLGVAIPLALTKRIKKNETLIKIWYYILERGFLLGFFAIFLQHVRPHVLNPEPRIHDWLIALLGFFIMFGIFTRIPQTWNKKLRWGIKIVSWCSALLLLYFLKYPDGSRFSLYRSDIIIVVLTNTVVWGSIIWLLTRNNHLLRLGILGLLLAMRLANQSNGWISVVWNFSPAPWIFKIYYLQYLFIVIPGTIIGDFFLSWMKTPVSRDSGEKSWPPWKLFTLLFIYGAILLSCLIGLQSRWVWQTFVVCSGLSIISWIMVKHPITHSEQLLQKLAYWGIYFLIIGLLFEPFEGGIKKDHSTLSYYLTTTGLAIFLLSIFLIIGDILGNKKLLNLLIDNGQNPMIAYVGMANGIWPIFYLLSLDKILLKITASPWLGFLRGVFYTFILSLVVQFLTRKKIFWKT